MGPVCYLNVCGEECDRDIAFHLNYIEINRSREEQTLQHRFYTTASAKSFAEIAEHWLGQKVSVEHIDL